MKGKDNKNIALIALLSALTVSAAAGVATAQPETSSPLVAITANAEETNVVESIATTANAPKGNNFIGYTSTDGIWGEVWGNASESFVIKVLDANGNVMGTTSLNNVGGIIDGDVTVSWNLKLDAASNTDEYWTMEWTTAPSINNMPAKVELWVDGVKVSGGNVVLNGPDDLNKINAVTADANGKITKYYTTFEAAVAGAQAGDQIVLLNDVTLSEALTLPAGVIFNGNGKQVNGTLYAGGDLTFVGHTKVTAFSASYYNRTITIGEGACLEVTGTGRVTLGYGNTFNITGSIKNAKTATMARADVQPSLIIPGGMSITGGNNATMNVTNAYIKVGSTTSKPGAANGTFTMNFTNSIVDFTKEFGLYEPTSGMNPTFKVTIKDSIFTTGTKLCIAAPNSNVVIDNSVVTLGSHIRNSGNLTLKNGSELTGTTIQFGENGGNNGTIIVDNSALTIGCGGSAAQALDGKGTGNLILVNGATAEVEYFTGMTVAKDATSTFTSKTQDAQALVAQIGNTYYATFEEAVADIATDGSDTTIKLLSDVELSESVVFNYGSGKVIFTADKPVVVKQTKVGLNMGFKKADKANIIIEKNVTFEIYDNASGMYVYYGPSLTVNGTVTGGQNWGVLYLFNGNHVVSETGKVSVGRVQLGYTEIEVYGEVDTNYLLVEGSTFTANGATIDANVIYDNNNGGQRWGKSNFNIVNSKVTTSKLTLSYAESEFNMDISSTLVADEVLGKGKIIIDATNFSESVQVITADMTGFTGEIKVIGDALLVVTDSGVAIQKPAAKIGNAGYETLEAAVAAAKSGDQIVLLNDVTLSEALTLPAGVTIKSNGYTINGSIRMLGDLTLNGALTITGGLWVGKSGETMTATLSGDKLTASYFMFQRGTYTINADIDAVYGYLSYEGTFEVNSTIHTTGANGEVLYINGNVTLNDGAVLDSDNSVFLSNDAAVLTMKPGSKVDSKLNLKASGAKLRIDVSGLTVGEYTGITGTVTNSNGTIEVVNNDKLEAKIVDGKIVLAVKPVASVDGVAYETLADAIEKAQAGETIELLRDVTMSKILVIDKAITLDGKGRTLTSSAGRAINVSGANGATIKNLKINASGERAINVIQNATNVTIDKVIATASNYTVNVATSAPNAVVAIKNSTLNGLCTVNVASAGAEVTIDNSTINCNDNNTTAGESYAALNLGMEAVGGTITATNATINVAAGSDSMKAKNNAEDGSITIDGSTAEVTVMVAAITYAGSDYYYAFETLADAFEFAKAGDTITLLRDVDYGTTQLAITKAITLDLGGKTLTTRNAYGGMSIKGKASVVNGIIVHASNTAAIKVWNAEKFENLVINVQGKGDANKVIGGIVLQSGSTTKVGSIKNVKIQGDALTNGIETYNCGDASENVIGAMENVTIDAEGTGMLISAPCGTATNCTINGEVNGIEIWIKGNYSASLDLVGCTIKGGVYAHDELTSNPDVVNNGTLSLTTDAATTGVGDVTLTIARAAEQVEGLLKEIKDNAQAKLNNTYYATFAEALSAAQAGATIDLLADVTASEVILIGKNVTINGNGYKVTSSATRVFRVTVGGVEVTLNNVNMVSTAVRVGTNDVRGISIDIVDNVKLTLNGCSVDFTDASANDWAYAVNVTGGSNHAVTVNGGTYEGANVLNIRGASNTVVVKDATLNCLYPDSMGYAGACIWVLQNQGSSVEATGNTFNGSNAVAFNLGTGTGLTESNNTDNTKMVVAAIGKTYYTSIDEAITAAVEGETVKIKAGTYDRGLTVNKAGITVEAQGEVNFNGKLSINANGVTVKGLNFTNSGTAAYVGAKNVVIEDCTLMGSNGLYQSYTSGTVTFKDSTITGSTYGIHFDGSAGGNIVIDNCVITGWTSFAGTITNVAISNTKFEKGHYNQLRFYQNAQMENCTFNESMTIDFGKGNVNADFTNCTVENNGTLSDVLYLNDLIDMGIKVTIDSKKVVAVLNDVAYTSLAEALANVGAGDVVIELLANATLDYNARDVYGTANTNSITINGNGNTLTLNQKNSDWASIGLANANGKLVLNNMTIEKTGYGDTSGAWNTHAIIFKSNVKMTDVTVNNSMAVSAGATLNNVTIKEANGYYGLWIYANEQTVTVNGGEINATNGGRGIKIADQYIDNAEQVTLNVTGTKFTTAKKAAVLVTSTAGAKITASSVNIENVAADSTNFVWVDEDRSAHYGNVVVTGAKKAQEGVENFVAAVFENGSANAYYATLADAIAKAQSGATITLLKNIELTSKDVQVKGLKGKYNTYFVVDNKVLTIDLNGKNITANYEGTKMLVGLFSVSNAGNLTLKDSVGTAEVNVTATSEVYSLLVNFDSDTTLTVYGGSYKLDKASNSLVYADNSHQTTIYGGNFYLGNVGTGSNGMPWIFNASGNNVKKIIVKGGTYNAKINEQYWIHEVEIDETVSLVAKGEGVWEVVNEAAAYVIFDSTSEGYKARVNYATLEEAMAAAATKKNATVTLLEDVTMSEILVIDKAITLDGNGHTLKSTAARAINVSGADGVTIKNLTINASGERAINVIQNATNVTIDNVTAEASNYTVNLASSAANAVVTIKNSNLTGLNTVNVGAAGANVTIDNTKITCNDQTEVESYAAISTNKDAKGATVTATNCEVVVNGDSYAGKVVGEDGMITINGSTDGVVFAVAYINYGINQYTFNTLAAAIAKAEAGETVVMLRDVTISESIVIEKSITIDGNGKKLTYTGRDRAIDVPANADKTVNVAILNLTVDCTASYCQRGINYNENGELTLTNVNVSGKNVTYALNMPGSSDGATVTITGGSYTGNIALNVWGENATINATNTIFTAVDNNTVEGYAAVKLNNDGTTSAEGSVITITGGKIDVAGNACEDTEAVSNGTTTGVINISESTEVKGEIATMVAVIRYADGTSYSFMNLAEAFAAAKDGDEVKILAAGTYALSTPGKNITITGAVDGVVFDNIGAMNMGGASVTFNNVTFDYYPNVNYTGLQHSGNLVYNNCTFNGQVFLYGASETFNKCTFNQDSSDAYNVWTYGAKQVEFNECTFNSAGKSVLVYTETASACTDLTVEKTTFNASATVDGKAAIEIDTSLSAGANINVTKSTATGFGTGNVSGNSLWNNKKGSSGVNNDITIVVDDTTVLAPAAEVVFYGANLTVGVDLSLNFYVQSEEALAGKEMSFSIYDYLDKKTLTSTGVGVAETVNGVNVYKFTFKGVGPHLMGQDINATLPLANGELTFSYTVKKYAHTQLDMDDAALADSLGLSLTAEDGSLNELTEEKIRVYRTFLANLMNYGAASQKYANKNVADKDLVTAGLSKKSLSYITHYHAVEPNNYVDIDPENVTVGAALILKSTNKIEILIQVNGDPNSNATKFAGWTAKVYGPGHRATKMNFTQSSTYKTYYSIIIDNIRATEYDNNYDIFICDATGKEVGVTSYSVQQYVNKKQNEETAIGELTRAIWNYYHAAEDYIDEFVK